MMWSSLLHPAVRKTNEGLSTHPGKNHWTIRERRFLLAFPALKNLELLYFHKPIYPMNSEPLSKNFLSGRPRVQDIRFMIFTTSSLLDDLPDARHWLDTGDVSTLNEALPRNTTDIHACGAPASLFASTKYKSASIHIAHGRRPTLWCANAMEPENFWTIYNNNSSVPITWSGGRVWCWHRRTS
jgi:hypothetical protein